MEKKLIDDCFYVEQKRWGTWQSHYEDGAGIITSLTEEECVRSTRWYLKSLQDGFVETKTYESFIPGKL